MFHVFMFYVVHLRTFPRFASLPILALDGAIEAGSTMATILLVDDHPDESEVVGQMLELHGHVVSLAESGELAWEQMQQSPPDALVIDQRLPGISGIELLHRMRKTPSLAKVAV